MLSLPFFLYFLLTVTHHLDRIGQMTVFSLLLCVQRTEVQFQIMGYDVNNDYKDSSFCSNADRNNDNRL